MKPSSEVWQKLLNEYEDAQVHILGLDYSTRDLWESTSLLLALLVQRQGEVRFGSTNRGFFHPKVYVVERESHNHKDSVVLMGSGNWSTAALEQSPDSNVEVGGVVRSVGHVWRRELVDFHASEYDAGAAIAHEAYRLFGQAEVVASWSAPTKCCPLPHLHYSTSLRAISAGNAATDALNPWVNSPIRAVPTTLDQARRIVLELVRKFLGLGTLHPDIGVGVLNSLGPYQKDGARRLLGIIEDRKLGGAILADATGLGKTYCALALIAHYHLNRQMKVSILAPASTVEQWKGECEREFRQIPGLDLRVISHSALVSAVKDETTTHLLRSDFVVVDESHNFRSQQATRTKLLRDILKLPLPSTDPQQSFARRVLLLTATPINNRLEDLRQQLSLFLSEPSATDWTKSWDNWPDGAKLKEFLETNTEDGLSQKIKFHTEANAMADMWKRQTLEEYLASQEHLLEDPHHQHRLLDELARAVIVRRTRTLLERMPGGLPNFRPAMNIPQRQSYADPNMEDLLIQKFLPLFDSDNPDSLTLSVYRWNESSYGKAGYDSLKGLVRVQLLKRLESGRVAFLASILRLAALHAQRLVELHQAGRLESERIDALDRRDARINHLCGDRSSRSLVQVLAESSTAFRVDTETFEENEDLEIDNSPLKIGTHQLELLDSILQDFERILPLTIQLANQCLPGLPEDWPHNLIARNNTTWPKSRIWARNLIDDPKLRAVVSCVFDALNGPELKKVIVFSQFAETLEILRSVLQAVDCLTDEDLLGFQSRQRLVFLRDHTGLASGQHLGEDRELVMDRFAPFYRIRPFRPQRDDTQWESRWVQAIAKPIHVLLASDVLAEGVNLQDAAVLVNFDLHWNPVKMIQRSGRIDRRLNQEIEAAQEFSDVASVAAQHKLPTPAYHWHAYPSQSPMIVNIVPPEKLDRALGLSLIHAVKTELIDQVVGLDSSLGLTDWTHAYQFLGPRALEKSTLPSHETLFIKFKKLEEIVNAQNLEFVARNAPFCCVEFPEVSLTLSELVSLSNVTGKETIQRGIEPNFRTPTSEELENLLTRAILGTEVHVSSNTLHPRGTPPTISNIQIRF